MVVEGMSLFVHVHHMDDGTVRASMAQVVDGEHTVILPSTGYSSSSLLFEELSSWVDAILWVWAAATTSYPMGGPTG